MTFAMVVVVEGIALACNCVDQDLAASIEKADIVAFGEVEHYDVRTGCNKGAEVRIRVLQGFVGAEVGEVIVLDGPDPRSSCSLDFDPGETWLVFGADGHADFCASIRVAADAPILEEVAALVGQRR